MVVFRVVNFVNYTMMNNVTSSVGGLPPVETISGSSDDSKKFGMAVNLAAYCYIMPTVAVVGLLGNVANLITLASPRLKAVSYMYLRALGIADLLCMCFVLVFVFFEILKAHHYDSIVGDYGAAWYRAHLMLPLINTSISAGILTVVALTVERYISICWPMLFREWNSPKRAGTLIFFAYVIPFLLYIPMCWQMKVEPKNMPRARNATNDSTIWSQDIFWTDRYDDYLANTNSYKAYKWTRETLLKFVPIVTLAVLNLQIIFTFRKIRKRRQRLTTSGNQNVREQRSLLILLAGIAILFFVCNTPAAINLVIISEEAKKFYGFVLFRAMSNLLEITNHALNFYVFCLCSTDYRQTFLQTFPMVKNLTQRTTALGRRMSERKSLKSNNLVKSTGTSTVLTTKNKNYSSNIDKKKRQKSNGICPVSDRKRRRSSKNVNDKFIHATANDEERRPMTADRGSDGTVDMSFADNYDSRNSVENNAVRRDNSVISRCGYTAVLTNDDDSVVINNVSSASFNEDIVVSGETNLSSNRNSTIVTTDNGSNRKQSTTIIINEYCLCDEGADDVSL